jgi:phosphatidylglycerol:prolipoprotein diacylglycerol transferase
MTPRSAYTLFMLLALGVFVLVRYLIPKSPDLIRLPAWQRLLLALAAFAGGAIGAKLPFVISGLAAPSGSTPWLADGKTLTTGLAGGYLAVELAKLGLGIRVKTGDSFALPLALALAVGRLGCFFNGCCYGKITTLPWGIDFGDGTPRHPTQLYESAFHLAMAGLLWLLLARRLLVGNQLKLYLICYGVFRFATEYLRPEPAWSLGLTFYQWAALLLAAALAVQWRFDRNAPRPTMA